MSDEHTYRSLYLNPISTAWFTAKVYRHNKCIHKYVQGHVVSLLFIQSIATNNLMLSSEDDFSFCIVVQMYITV